MTSPTPSYIPVPLSAIPIPPVSPSSSTRQVPPKLPTQASFPPSSSAAAGTSSSGSGGRKFSVTAQGPSIASNVSDLLLSSLLPQNLPKLPPTSAASAVGPGRPLPLSTQRDALSLNLMSNNFRRFVTRVGPLFWVQDRIEEVLFWRKPVWTWAWLLAWTLISFNPRLLLLIPFLSLLVLLLHTHEKQTPLPSLLGVPDAPTSAGTARVVANDSSFSATTTLEGEGTSTIPAVPPKEAESGVDYYMNLQAIQNTMGWISDAYDELAPLLTQLSSPTPSPTSLPITPTTLILLLLPPSLLLPLAPPYLIPYVVLPLGILPTLAFHPNISPLLASLPRNRMLLEVRATLDKLLLNDALPDGIGAAKISQVEVWENERLDPSWSAKVPLPPHGTGAFGAKFLRAGERAPWVKVAPNTTSGNAEGEEEWSAWKSAGGDVPEGDKTAVLALKDGWDWIPSEEWRVDVCGLWSEVGTDDDGWVYSDDSWQSPCNTQTTEAEPPNAPNSAPSSTLPSIAVRRVTRRRRWSRRVYRAVPDHS